jgi:small subunit ribosomal protein S19
MSRSVWKGVYVDTALFKIKRTFQKKKKVIRIWSRNSTITRLFLGKRVLIHDGQFFKPLIITKDKIGYKFGEFIFTKIYSSKEDKKKEGKKITKK